MSRGVGYETAHSLSLARYGVTEFELCAREVVEMFPRMFNSVWRAFHGIIK